MPGLIKKTNTKIEKEKVYTHTTTPDSFILLTERQSRERKKIQEGAKERSRERKKGARVREKSKAKLCLFRYTPRVSVSLYDKLGIYVFN